VAEADGAGSSGGVRGEQGAILGGAELGWGPGPDLTRVSTTEGERRDGLSPFLFDLPKLALTHNRATLAHTRSEGVAIARRTSGPGLSSVIAENPVLRQLPEPLVRDADSSSI
jgi:hypothetical protein